jgi:DNA polymerase-3 subunit epsilon/ATP-dependent DNA helicase DinG
MESIFVALDLEMTGLEVGEDEIIEVGAVKFQGREVLETFSSLVRPRRSLPLKITRITGINAADLAGAPSFNDIAPDLARFIKSYPLVGHSFDRDLGMLRAQGMSLPQTVYDTFALATLLLPRIVGYKLGSLAEHFGISHPDAHRALNDADVTRQVFLSLLDSIAALELPDLAEMIRLAEKIDWSLHELLGDIRRYRLKHAFAVDEPIRAEQPDGAQEQDLGPLWGGDETALAEHAARGDTHHPLKPTGTTAALDLERVAAFFAPDGAISRVFRAYEQRPQQVEMSRATAEAFNEGKVLLVEAGTGTGKSMAYLVPSALFAMQRGERVVISTNTINLQDQLYFKDIPDLQRIMQAAGRRAQSKPASSNGDSFTVEAEVGPAMEPTAEPFTAALLKGRSNYLCLRRYRGLRSAENIQPDEARLLLKVQFWLPTTISGDSSELLLTERERAAWSQVNVPADTCIGHHCPDFQRCFFFKARRKAESVHLLVVNHALLLADLVAQSRVLPPYDHLIIDEAHNLEEVATDQFSFAIDQALLLQFLDSLFLEGGEKVVSGLLSELPARLREAAPPPTLITAVERAIGDMLPAIERSREATSACFHALVFFVNQEIETNESNYASERLYDVRLRLTPAMRRKAEWETVEHAWDNLSLSLAAIGDGLGKLEAILLELDADDIPDYNELLLRVQSVQRYATEVRVETGHIVFGDEEDIYWITQNRLRSTLTLHAAPLSVADMLQANLFEQKCTTALTSATLSIGDSLEFVKSRLGLADTEELVLESPFDYEQQALVFIPNDIPEPNQRGYQQGVEETLIQLGAATGGRTLALFTSNSAIRRTIEGIQEALEDQDIVVLGQGVDGSRKTLLERFKECPRTILLGTSSFWEGVDIVGDALSVLVIAKLPFSVPSDPIFAARSEQFTDPFLQYTVPQSILRFKQGFGRLIRSKEDRGVVVVLDKRLLTKKYGMLFLQSLPSTSVREGSMRQLPQVVARFLGQPASKNNRLTM